LYQEKSGNPALKAPLLSCLLRYIAGNFVWVVSAVSPCAQNLSAEQTIDIYGTNSTAGEKNAEFQSQPEPSSSVVVWSNKLCPSTKVAKQLSPLDWLYVHAWSLSRVTGLGELLAPIGRVLSLVNFMKNYPQKHAQFLASLSIVCRSYLLVLPKMGWTMYIKYICSFEH
jgi:hypothetical protein